MSVSSIVMQADGKIVIGGAFASMNGIRRFGIARLNSDGTLDTTFSSPLEHDIGLNTLALQKDGKVLFGGWYPGYPPLLRLDLLRLNANGSVDGSFNPILAGGYASVNSIVVQEDGKVIVGGYFGPANGISRNGI